MQLLISILVIIIAALSISIIGIIFFYKQNKDIIKRDDMMLKAFEENLEQQLINADTLAEILQRLNYK